MAEEVVEKKEDVKDDTQTPEYSESEKQAMEQGWVPKDQWKGDPEDWTPAKQFLKYGELESELKRQREGNKHLNKVVDKMKHFYSSVKEDAKKEVLDSLKRAKREALSREDFEEVAKIDAQLEGVDESLQRSFKKGDHAIEQIDAERPKDTEPNPEFVEWHKNNKWYKLGPTGGVDDVSKYADDLAIGYVTRNPSAPREEVFNYVTKQVKKTYPDLFENPRRKDPPAVDEGGEKVSGEGKGKKIKLTDEEKAVADGFGISYEKYAEHLASYNKMKGAA